MAQPTPPPPEPFGTSAFTTQGTPPPASGQEAQATRAPGLPPNLQFNFQPGIENALGLLGGNSENILNNILNANVNESFLQSLIQGNDTGRVQIGVQQIKDLLGSGNVDQGGRASFLNTILGIQNPNSFNADLGIIQGNQQFGQMFQNLPPNIQQALLALMNPDADPPVLGPLPDHTNQAPGDGSGGGGGNGFSFEFGEGLFDLTSLPNFDLIQQTLASFLSGDNPFQPLEIDDPLGGLRGLTEKSIKDLLRAEGLPQHIIDRATTTITQRLKSSQADARRASADNAASRGIFDSGLAERSERDIRQRSDETLARQLSDLGLQNAMQAAGQRQLGLQGANLLGNLGLATQSLGIQGGLGARAQDLTALQTGLGGLLGLGNLGIENIQTDLQRQLEEFRLGLIANSLFGEGGGESDIPPGLAQLLTGGGFLNTPTQEFDINDFIPDSA